MALNIDKDLKTYYTIKEVAEMFHLTESTLRYWETEFPNLKPRTGTNKVRQYSAQDIDDIRIIYNLVKVRGFKLAAARKMINANRSNVDKSAKILENLQAIKEDLQALKNAVDKVV